MLSRWQPCIVNMIVFLCSVTRRQSSSNWLYRIGFVSWRSRIVLYRVCCHRRIHLLQTSLLFFVPSPSPLLCRRVPLQRPDRGVIYILLSFCVFPARKIFSFPISFNLLTATCFLKTWFSPFCAEVPLNPNLLSLQSLPCPPIPFCLHFLSPPNFPVNRVWRIYVCTYMPNCAARKWRKVVTTVQ